MLARVSIQSTRAQGSTFMHRIALSLLLILAGCAAPPAKPTAPSTPPADQALDRLDKMSRYMNEYPEKVLAIPLDFKSKGVLIAVDMITISSQFAVIGMDGRHGAPTKLWDRDANRVIEPKCRTYGLETEAGRAEAVNDLVHLFHFGADSAMGHFVHDNAREKWLCVLPEPIKGKTAGGISFSQPGLSAIMYIPGQDPDGGRTDNATFLSAATDDKLLIIRMTGTPPVTPGA
jgi:hypothetical protein